MKEAGIKQKLKEFIGHYAWRIFLWSGDWTEDSFNEAKYFDEKMYREKHNLMT